MSYNEDHDCYRSFVELDENFGGSVVRKSYYAYSCSGLDQRSACASSHARQVAFAVAAVDRLVVLDIYFDSYHCMTEFEAFDLVAGVEYE